MPPDHFRYLLLAHLITLIRLLLTVTKGARSILLYLASSATNTNKRLLVSVPKKLSTSS